MKDDLNISYGIDVDQQLLKILENELKKEDEIEKRRELIKKRKEKIENLWKI